MKTFKTHTSKGIREVQGTRVDIPNEVGAEFFAYKSTEEIDGGWWFVVETQTGLSVGKSPQRRKDAIESAKRNIAKVSPEKLAAYIAAKKMAV